MAYHHVPDQLRLGILQENNRYQDQPTTTVMFNTLNSLRLFRGEGYDRKHKIQFINCSTNQAMEHYKLLGMNVAILNFANATSVCGGVELGSKAQEEDLCLTSPMLYSSLKQFARFGTDRRWKYTHWESKDWDHHILYTPNILFRRHDSMAPTKFSLLQNEYRASVITAAAPDSRRIIRFDIHHPGILKLSNDIERIIKHIYYAPLNASELIAKPERDKFGAKWLPTKPMRSLENPPTVLILGAWGCGAFSPQANKKAYKHFMAERFKAVLDSLIVRYDIICFAIMDSNVDLQENNYNIFLETINTCRHADVTEVVLQRLPIAISQSFFTRGFGFARSYFQTSSATAPAEAPNDIGYYLRRVDEIHEQLKLNAGLREALEHELADLNRKIDAIYQIKYNKYKLKYINLRNTL